MGSSRSFPLVVAGGVVRGGSCATVAMLSLWRCTSQLIRRLAFLGNVGVVTVVESPGKGLLGLPAVTVAVVDVVLLLGGAIVKLLDTHNPRVMFIRRRSRPFRMSFPSLVDVGEAKVRDMN